MRRLLIYFFSFIFFIFLRFSFLPALGLSPFVHLSLIVLFFTVIVWGKKNGLFMAGFLGIIDGLYAWQAPFFFYLILYCIMVLEIDYLLTVFFTNRSLSTITLVSSLGSLCFFLFENLFWKILFFFPWWNISLIPFFLSIPFFLWQTFTTSLLILFSFYILQKIGLIFRTSFLPVSILKK